VEFKRRLAQQACEPGMSVARLALEHGLNANLLFKWCRCYRAGEFDAPAKPALLPVTVVGDHRSMPDAAAKPQPLSTPAEAKSLAAQARIEVQFADAVVRIDSGADAALLRTVLTVLRP